ncbi:hypothetical protein D0Z07_1174 [Hyphodiscus hymeniophilus]|uniref:Ornithine decarboxylase antizyme n=1 Tax=Hyphodiscus hymeniophilus TaxID=353542 RepID=A0A9P6VR51_9HELO|nr:hypothetical protein D0Z07_1174 [Hyphodiscus hymeniophilus]
MKTVFLGDEGRPSTGSNVMGANAHSPPEEDVDVYNNYFGKVKTGHVMDAWLEIWDYSGACSFRGFVAGKGDQKCLFAFFDSAVIGRDLKQGLMALIELAESVFALHHVVICLDRSVPEADAKAFMKSLRWVGFELVTMDMWAEERDITSEKWLLLGASGSKSGKA